MVILQILFDFKLEYFLEDIIVEMFINVDGVLIK